MARGVFPSLDKEGWREAPGWFDQSARPPRRLRRHPSSKRRGRMAGMHRWCSFRFLRRALGGKLHRLDDLLVAGAAAQVPADRIADLRLGRIRIRVQQSLRGDEHSRRAVAALQAVRLAEAVLQNAHRAVGFRETLDGGDAVAVRLHRVHEAGPYGFPVEHHRARAADAVLAADVRAGEEQVVAQPVDQRQPRRHLGRSRLAVDLDGDGVKRLAHRLLALSRASRSARAASTPARCRRYSALAWRSLPGCVSVAAACAASFTAASSRRVPTRRAAIFGNASGVPPAPPRPNAARTQRPSPSIATWAAAATIAKSPWRTEISVKAEPVCRQDHAGQWISSRHSSDRADVAMGPEKNLSASSVRVPLPERSSMRAPSTCATSGSSAHGSACARLPPKVPRFLVCTCPTQASACARSGTRAARAGSRSIVHCRVQAPVRTASFSTETNLSAAISLMSMSHAPRTRRIAIIGTRLWPPARSFAPSPWRRSSSQASATDAARAYSKGGAFKWPASPLRERSPSRVSVRHRRRGYGDQPRCALVCSCDIRRRVRVLSRRPRIPPGTRQRAPASSCA